jgi:hypothetical protein
MSRIWKPSSILVYMLSLILPSSRAITACTLSKAADLAVTARHLGGLWLLNEDEESSFKRQSPRTSDTIHSKVRGPSSMRGPPSAFSPPLAPSSLASPALEPLPLARPPLVPPPLGRSCLPPSLPLPAPTKPAPPKPDIADGVRKGEDGRRAQERLPSPCTCALQRLSGSLEHCKVEPRLDKNGHQFDHDRWGRSGFSPTDF